nr:hypothetical protein [uncultured Chryseobacterium sp.]
MNTSKNNLEFQIKKQIEEREIEPSRDLWSEIELQSGNNHDVKPRVNWFIVAACLLVVVGLGSILFFSGEPIKNNHKMVKETKSQATQTQEITSEHTKLSMTAQENQEQTVKHKSSQEAQESISALSQPKINVNKVILKEFVQQKKPIAAPYADAKIIAQVDSLKTPVKKKSYVDPETLLFSVEHKDIIEKTKGKSNVATIDLNGK